MTDTPNLNLPYIMPSQAQKHVTHNEAIRALDAQVQIGIAASGLAAPPAGPAEGARYIVGAGATGSWTGRDDEVAAWQDGAWAFYPPRAGWLAWIAAETRLVVFDGIAWVDAPAAVNPVAMVGVNTSADATNRLAVASPAVLFTHEGAGHQLKINKHLASDTASLLFQTGYSGRAELGLTGSEALRIKVSADGTSWRDVLSADPASGEVTLADAHTGELAVEGKLTVQTATGEFLRVATAADPDRGGYEWTGWYAAGVETNGPAGDANYVDDVFAFGVNMGGVGQKADPDRQYAAWHLESKFYQNAAQASPYTELHFNVVDKNGGYRRPISWIGAHDGSYGNAGMAATLIALQGHNHEPKVDFQFGAGRIDIWDGIVTAYGVGNVPVARQASGGSSVNLPFIDDAGYTVVASAIVGPSSAGTKNAGGLTVTTRGGSTNTLTANAPGAGASNFQLSNGVTQAASGSIPVTANGTTTATAASGAVAEADIGRAITGATVPANTLITDVVDATHFKTNNALPATVIAIVKSARTQRTASFGNDNGGNVVFRGDPDAGGMFFDHYNDVFFRDMAAGYATRMHLYAGNLGIGVGYVTGAKLAVDGPIRMKSYTVAGLPSASAAGAGAIVYVSDASGGPTLACSNGAAWRVVAALGATVS